MLILIDLDWNLRKAKYLPVDEGAKEEEKEDRNDMQVSLEQEFPFIDVIEVMLSLVLDVGHLLLVKLVVETHRLQLLSVQRFVHIDVS